MLAAQRPLTLLRGQVRTLESHLAAVRDGDPKACTRLGSRHGGSASSSADVTERHRRRPTRSSRSSARSGDRLVRFESADVQASLLRSLEAHLPSAVPTLRPAAPAAGAPRLDLMRDTIKELERIEIDRLLQSVQHGLIGARRRLLGGWDHLVRRAIADRADGAREGHRPCHGRVLPEACPSGAHRDQEASLRSRDRRRDGCLERMARHSRTEEGTGSARPPSRSPGAPRHAPRRRPGSGADPAADTGPRVGGPRSALPVSRAASARARCRERGAASRQSGATRGLAAAATAVAASSTLLLLRRWPAVLTGHHA